MKLATAIRHVEFEDLGVFGEVLKRRGYDVAYLDVGNHENSLWALRDIAMLIVLGGPIGAYEDAVYPFVADEIALISYRLAHDLPTFGICLGAQLIARALGANVYPGPAKEIGWSELTLSDAGRQGPLKTLEGVKVLHWHGDTFDLPAGAVRLASTTLCANQAFAVGDHVMACQFHPEANSKRFERWLIGHAHEVAATPGVSVEGLRAQALAAGDGSACQTAFDTWLSQLERVKA